MAPSTDPVRADVWIWAARFAKTRTLAADAIKTGRVQVNGIVAKPSREIRPGDRLELRRSGGERLEVDVLATARRRGPASEAQQLYNETDESVRRREQRAQEHQVERARYEDGGARPTKRDRRLLEQLRARGRGREPQT